MPRNARGQFTAGEITLPGFSGMYKILFICVILFPWYAILSNKHISGQYLDFY